MGNEKIAEWVEDSGAQGRGLSESAWRIVYPCSYL